MEIEDFSPLSANSTPIRSLDVSRFLSKMQEYKGSFKGTAQWCNDLASASWKTNILEITATGSLRYYVGSESNTTGVAESTIEDKTLVNSNNHCIIRQLQDCRIQIVEERNQHFPLLLVTTNTGREYFRTLSEADFDGLLCSLIWWSGLKPKGIFNKMSFQPPHLQLVGKEPANLLVSQLVVFGPLPTNRRIPVIRQLSKPNFLERSNVEEGWFPAMGVLKSDGTLDLLLQSDGSLIYTLDITVLLRSEIRLVDSSLQNDNLLFLGTLPALRHELNISTKSNFILNGPITRHSPGIIFKFPLLIDVEDWLLALNSFAIAEYLSLTGAHNSNKLRVSNRFRLSIIEGDFKDLSLSSQDRLPSLYVEISIWNHIWGRTPVIRDTETPFWREEFTFNESVRINNLRIEVKQRHQTINMKDQLIGYIDITQEMINDINLGKETRLPVIDTNNKRFKVGTICIKIISNLKFVLPSTNFLKFEKALSEVNLSQITNYFNDYSLGADSSLEDISTICLDVFQVLGREDDWFAALIDKELTHVDGSIARNTINNKTSTHIYGTLFRGNSILTRSMETYFYRVGREYLEKSIGPLLKVIIGSEKTCEVDPARIKEPDAEKKSLILENNHQRLMKWVEKVWMTIYKTSNDIPIAIKNQMTTLRKKLELICIEDDHTRVLNCVSGMLFLRFFCPVILNPKLFQFVPIHLDDTSRRTLTLISKTLLNLSNLTVFGNKEPYMKGMNSFIENHNEEMLDYIDKITQKKLDFSVKTLKLASTMARPKLSMNKEVLAELPTNPHLIDRYLRETELFAALATYIIKREGDTQILQSISLEQISRNMASIEVSVEERRAEIGELEFEKITDNNVEVFGDDLMKYLEEDDELTANGKLLSRSDIDMREQLEQEAILLFHKVEHLKRLFVDYEFPTENEKDKVRYAKLLAENTYCSKSREIIVDTGGQLAEAEGMDKLFNAPNGTSSLLSSVMPRPDPLSTDESIILSPSDGSSGIVRNFSRFRSAKVAKTAMRNSEEKKSNGPGGGFKRWFKRVK